MDEIRPWLFIGKYRNTLQLSYLRAKSIQAMLQLVDKVEQPGIASFFLPVEDFAPLNFNLLEQGVSFIREQKKLDKRILVACGAGINRSSAFVLPRWWRKRGYICSMHSRKSKKCTLNPCCTNQSENRFLNIQVRPFLVSIS
ncbi:MAG TPA: dual specificity protein phosphatase [Anaerolineales bacterium]